MSYRGFLIPLLVLCLLVIPALASAHDQVARHGDINGYWTIDENGYFIFVLEDPGEPEEPMKTEDQYRDAIAISVWLGVFIGSGGLGSALGVLGLIF